MDDLEGLRQDPGVAAGDRHSSGERARKADAGGEWHDHLDRPLRPLGRSRLSQQERRDDGAEHGKAVPAGFTELQDRKSTRLNSVTNAHLVCRLMLEKNKKHMTSHPPSPNMNR